MAIYRGDGGAGDATNDVTTNQIAELSLEAENSATAAASSATSASSSASAASTSETNAANSATSAGTSATNAASSASSASTSASNASTSETNAAASETNAAASEAAAALSETAAAASETNAATSATNAATSETNASNSATAAASSAGVAALNATSSADSASSAATSASNAATSETNAASSATSASNDAATATTKASEASTSASNAATSETNAAASESAAAISATNASTSETNAAASETAAASSASAAATSETNAATSASGASTSASNAATSASNAATSETNAATSETNAAASATAAAASAASAASSDYATSSWYTTTNNSSNWDTAYGWGDHASAGYVVATGGTMTGDLSFGDNDKAVFGAGSDLYIYHDGSNSYIQDAGTGNLLIRGASVEITTAIGTKYFQGGSNVARLYNTGNEKLATTSTGIDVTGTVTADGANLDGAVVINESGANVDFRIESDTNVNAFFLEGSNGNVGIGTSLPSYKAEIDSGSLGTSLNDRSDTLRLTTNTSNVDTLNFSKIRTSAGTDWTTAGWRLQQRIDVTNMGYIQLNGDSNSQGISFGLGDSTELMRINSAGNVGIGTISPSTKLDVNGTVTATGGNSTNWNTAYGWGDHASAGYLVTDTTGNKAVNGNPYLTQDTLTDGATITWTPTNGTEAFVTLGGNRTLVLDAVPPAGTWLTLLTRQDGTGSRTLAYSATYFAFGGAGTPVLSTAANAYDILSFRSNGTRAEFVGIAQGFTA